MNTDNENSDDKIVASAYRNYSRETVPDDINRAILQKSRIAGRKSILSRLYAWRRPLAFAATLIIGVSLVYDMQKLLQEPGEVLLPMPVADPNSAATPANDLRESDLDEAQVLDAATTRARQESARPGGSPPSRKLSAPPQAVEAEAPQQQQMRVNEQRATSLNGKAETAKLPAARLDAVSGDARSAPAGLAAKSRLQDKPACGEEQTASAEAWSRCIQDMRETGASEAADAELQKLKRRFPDFQVPN